MKAVILAGGLGTRLAEETQVRPKPMVEIGGMPILWHIMKIYSAYGITDFIICLGYKGEYIKEWFMRYRMYGRTLTMDFLNDEVRYHEPAREPWRVVFVDTGSETMTGGRLLRIREYVENERFLMTYGDGVADIDISALLQHHDAHGTYATLTTVIPEGRFGEVEIGANTNVLSFAEKKDNTKRINGGFFVLEPNVFDFLTNGDATIFEQEPLRMLAQTGQLTSYAHHGFWRPMDTLTDKNKLEDLWKEGAPWKLW